MLRPATDCPACGVDQPTSGGFINFCQACGHRWLQTTDRQQESIETRTYTRNYAGYRADPVFVETATNFTRAELATRVPPPARLLDVGCGAGEFMAVATTFGYEVEGIDISEAGVEICRSRGLKARAADFLTEDFGHSFDIITMWDVVEHLKDPAGFLERARSLLSPGGILFTKIPGFGDLSVAISNLVPRTAGTLLGAPSHVQYFDRESLGRLLSRADFSPEWIDGGRARSGLAGGSMKKRLARKVKSFIGQMSGDANFYVVARPQS